MTGKLILVTGGSENNFYVENLYRVPEEVATELTKIKLQRQDLEKQREELPRHWERAEQARDRRKVNKQILELLTRQDDLLESAEPIGFQEVWLG